MDGRFALVGGFIAVAVLLPMSAVNAHGRFGPGPVLIVPPAPPPYIYGPAPQNYSPPPQIFSPAQPLYQLPPIYSTPVMPPYSSWPAPVIGVPSIIYGEPSLRERQLLQEELQLRRWQEREMRRRH